MKLGAVVAKIETVIKGNVSFHKVNLFSKDLNKFLNGYIIF